jgi:hypothetical protein
MPVPKLKDQSLLKTGVAYVNGEWVKAKSGKTLEVFGTAYHSSTSEDLDTDYESQIHHQGNSSAQPPNSPPKTPNSPSTPPPQLSPLSSRKPAANARSC